MEFRSQEILFEETRFRLVIFPEAISAELPGCGLPV
jgi:hypothetical protein